MNANNIEIYEKKGKSLKETREQAAVFVIEIRRIIKAIEDELRPDIKKAHELHVDLLSRLKRFKSPFFNAQKIVDAEISHDYLEQESIRKEEENRLRKEAEEAEKLRQAELEKEAIALADDRNVDEAVSIMEEAKEKQIPEPVKTKPVDSFWTKCW